MIQDFVSPHTGAGVPRTMSFIESTSPQHVVTAASPNNLLCEFNNVPITADTYLFSYVQFADPAQFSQYCFSLAGSFTAVGMVVAPQIFRATCPKGTAVTPANFWSLMDTCYTWAVESPAIFGGASFKDAVSFNPFELDSSEDIDVYWGFLIWVAGTGTGPFALSGSVEGHCVTVDRSVYQPNK